MTYLPTPDEIKSACLEIQKEWDEETELKRRALRPVDNVIPGASLFDASPNGDDTSHKTLRTLQTKVKTRSKNKFTEG